MNGTTGTPYIERLAADAGTGPMERIAAILDGEDEATEGGTEVHDRGRT
jgi:hypothetical protein